MKKSAIHFHELNEQQKRQLIDAEMLFSALEQAEMETIRHRGSMFWREQDGGRYLIALSANSRQRSLGPASPENELKYERFTKRKEEVAARVKSLRVGRTPDILIDVLNVMMRFGVSQHFLVVGTHAPSPMKLPRGCAFPAT